MLEDRDQVLCENCELKSDEATRSSRTRTFITGGGGGGEINVLLCCYILFV